MPVVTGTVAGGHLRGESLSEASPPAATAAALPFAVPVPEAGVAPADRRYSTPSARSAATTSAPAADPSRYSTAGRPSGASSSRGPPP